MYKLGFIGAGNMGSALLAAAAKGVSPNEIAVCDHITEKAESVAKTYGAVATNILNIAKNAKFIFLGVKPQVMKDMLGEIKDVLKKRTDRFVLVSMAAGLSLEKLSNFCEADLPIIRIMPNTPVLVAEGMVLYCANQKVTAEETQEFLNIMKNSGEFQKLEETLFDAGCAVSGCGPAFVYMFINALVDGGESCGLSDNAAKKLACQTLIGAAKMVMNSEKSPNTLKEEVCSPGGCTIEGVKSLENDTFENTVKNAVVAAYEKSKKMGG